MAYTNVQNVYVNGTAICNVYVNGTSVFCNSSGCYSAYVCVLAGTCLCVCECVCICVCTHSSSSGGYAYACVYTRNIPSSLILCNSNIRITTSSLCYYACIFTCVQAGSCSPLSATCYCYSTGTLCNANRNFISCARGLACARASFLLCITNTPSGLATKPTFNITDTISAYLNCPAGQANGGCTVCCSRCWICPANCCLYGGNICVLCSTCIRNIYIYALHKLHHPRHVSRRLPSYPARQRGRRVA